METVEKKRFDAPDEVRELPNSKMEVVQLCGQDIMRATFQPGWRWSNDVKPKAGTGSCQAHHLGYALSGRLHVEMDNGEEMDFGPGDVMHVPPGHNAWVEGDEPFWGLDFTAGSTYAK